MEEVQAPTIEPTEGQETQQVAATTTESIEPQDEQININVPQKSKTQLKKEKAKQKWLDDKQKRKDIQKAKKKESKEKKRLEREANPEKFARPPKPADGTEHLTNKKIKLDYKNAVDVGQPVIIDCSFQDKLNDKETISLCRQICYSHAANKKAEKPVKLIISACTGKIRDQLVKMGAEHWGIHLLDKHYLDHYPKDKLVYLTGDATEDLTELDPETAYIIGGLVDHNRYKFATLNRAKEEGLQVKRLPISQHVDLKSSTILSVNHVFDIMVKVANGQDWGTATKESIPSRKKEGPPKRKKKREERKEERKEGDPLNEEEEEEDEEDQDNDDEPISENELADLKNDQTAPADTTVTEGTNNEATNAGENNGNATEAEKTA